MPTMHRIIVGANANVAADYNRNQKHHVQCHGEEQIVVEKTGPPNAVRMHQELLTNDLKSKAGVGGNNLTLLDYHGRQRRPIDGSAPVITIDMQLTAPHLARPLRASTSEQGVSQLGVSPKNHDYDSSQLQLFPGTNDRLLYCNSLLQQQTNQLRDKMLHNCYDYTTTGVFNDAPGTGVHPTMTNLSTVPMVSEMTTHNSYLNTNLVRGQTQIAGVAPQVLTLPSNFVPQQQISPTDVDISCFGQGTNDLVFAPKLPEFIFPVPAAGRHGERERLFSNNPLENTGKHDNMWSSATDYHHNLVAHSHSSDKRGLHQEAEDSSVGASKKKDEPKEQRRITYCHYSHPLNAYNFFFREEREIILTELKFALQKAGTKTFNLQQIQNVLDSPPTLPPEIQKDLKHRIKAKRREYLELRKGGLSRKRPPHRKSHGLIGFHLLSQAIGKRWKDLPKSSKRMAYFKQMALEERDHYKKIKKAFAKITKESNKVG